MASCVVCGRTKNNKSKLRGITFHKLPSSAIRTKWIKFAKMCGKRDTVIKSSSLFCSKHFSDTCFDARSTLLKSDVVPSIPAERVKSAKVLRIYPETTKPLVLDDIGEKVLSESSIKNISSKSCNTSELREKPTTVVTSNDKFEIIKVSEHIFSSLVNTQSIIKTILSLQKRQCEEIKKMKAALNRFNNNMKNITE